MKHFSQALLLGALGLLLSACDGEPDRVITYATWKQFPPHVEPQAKVVPVRLDLSFNPDSDAMTPDGEVALSNFLAQNNINTGAAVDLAVPLPRAGEGRLVRGRIGAVEKTLARRGILVSSVVASQDGVPGTISVVGNATTVQLPPCPGYNSPVQIDAEKQGVSNQGCSNTTNLDLMVANPSDLVQGRPLPPADGEGSTLGLQRYREGKVIAPVDVGTSQ